MYLSNQEIWATLLGNLGQSINDLLKQVYLLTISCRLAMHHAVLHSYAWSIASYHGKLDFSHTHIQGQALHVAECIFSLLKKDSIRRLCVSITTILDNFYTSYNHTDFGKTFLRNLGKFVGNIGNILRNASKKFR